MSDLAGFIMIANTSISSPFVGTSNYDLSFYTSSSNQKIQIGNTQNTIPAITVNGCNVGIDNGAPAYPLDVAGSVNFTGSLLQNGMAFKTSQFTTSSDNTSVYIQNSNLGIGKTNPSYPLDVTGSINFTGNLLQNGTSFKTSQFTTSSDNTSVYIQNSNIGIGLSNPVYPLDVSGNIHSTSYISSASTGSPPLSISSSTMVANLNTDLLHGQNGSFYTNAFNLNAGMVGVAYGGTGVTTSTGTGSIVLSANPTFTGTLTASSINATNITVGGLPVYGGSSNASNINSGILGVNYGGTGVTTSTGTGNIVLSANPTFTGTLTASSINATNITVGGLAVSGGSSNASNINSGVLGVASGGTGLTTSTGTGNVVLSTNSTIVNPTITGTMTTATINVSSLLLNGVPVTTGGSSSLTVDKTNSNILSTTTSNVLSILGNTQTGPILTAPWYGVIDGAGTETGLGVAIDAWGSNIFVSGKYSSVPPTVYGANEGSASTTVLPSASTGNNAGFAIKYNNVGAVQWGVAVDGVGNESIPNISLDVNGNLYVAGTYDTASATVYNAGGSNSGIMLLNPLTTSSFVGQYNSAGAAQWSSCITGANSNVCGSIAVDPTGSNIYVGGYYQTSQPVIYNIMNGTTSISPGVVSTLAGSGVASFADTNSYSLFNRPWGIAVDSVGNVYVGDINNNRIRKITSGGVVSTLAGQATGGFSDATGTNAMFNTPIGVAVDLSGNVYVGDYSNNKIRKITPAGVVSTFAGQQTGGYSDAMGTNAKFANPVDVAVDTLGNVYVADSNNQRIRKITAAGVVTTLAGQNGSGYSDATGTNAMFAYPYGVSVDLSGNVYVGDENNQRIRKITPGGVVSTLAGQNSSGFSDAVGTNAVFNLPYGVAPDTSGNVYVSDSSNNRIRKITTAGVVSTIAGQASSGYSDAVGANAMFNNPQCLCVDSLGNIYVSDTTGQKIRKITQSGSVTTIGGSTTQGFIDSGQASFNNPYGITVDTSGNVYVGDKSNNRIRKVTSGGVVSTLAGQATTGFSDATGTNAMFKNPYGVSTDTSGNIYVADSGNNKIRKIIGGVVSTLAGQTIAGYSDATGTNVMFNNPSGVSVDISGNIYVADSGNYRIRKIMSGGVVSTLAGSGGQGFSDATGANALFNNVYGLSVDLSGNVYVADCGNNRIRKITATGVVSTLAGQATAGFSDATGTNALFNNPNDVTVDSNGNVYVDDTGNNKIRKITPAGIVSTLAGNGASFADGTSTLSSFNSPYGISLDSVNNLYIADVNNNKIRKITFPGSPAITASSLTLPTPTSKAAYAIKYNSSGTPQWATGIDGTGIEQSNNVTVDSSGNVYVAGQYSTAAPTIYSASGNSSVNSGLTLATPGTNPSAFLVQYTAAGVATWAVAMVGSGVSTDVALSVTTDALNNVIVVGSYDTSSPIIYNAGNSASSYTLPSPNNIAAFIVKYNYAGTVQWCTSIDGIGNDSNTSVTTDSSGNIYVSGYYTLGSPTIYAASGTTTAISTITLPSVTSSAAYAINFNSSGVPQWAIAVDSASADQGNGIKVDNNGNVYLAGQFNAVATAFNNYGVVTNTLATPSGTGAFLVQYQQTTGLLPYILNQGNNSNGDQKLVLNTSSSNATLYVSSSNIVQSTLTVAPSQTMSFTNYNGKWWRYT